MRVCVCVSIYEIMVVYINSGENFVPITIAEVGAASVYVCVSPWQSIHFAEAVVDGRRHGWSHHQL